MHLIIAPGTVPQARRDIMPSTGTPGWATDGNPALNIPATDDLSCHYNMMMAEIVQVILDAGIELDATNWGQLSAAIQNMIGIEKTRAEAVEKTLADEVATLNGYPVPSIGTSPASGDSTGILWVKTGGMCRLMWKETNVYDTKTILLPFNFSTGYFFGSQIAAPAGWASWVNGTVGSNTVTLHVGKQSGGASGAAASGDGFSASMLIEGMLAT